MLATFAPLTLRPVGIAVGAELDEAVLPFAGTSGWSGTATSRERATENDRTGKTKQVQQDTLNALQEAGAMGLTWGELAGRYDWHHGAASASLSALHKHGLIARLSEQRGRCKVYVAHEFINDRPTEQYGRKKPALEAVQDLLCDCYCCNVIQERLAKL
jgi:hypothetical protein